MLHIYISKSASRVISTPPNLLSDPRKQHKSQTGKMEKNLHHLNSGHGILTTRTISGTHHACTGDGYVNQAYDAASTSSSLRGTNRLSPTNLHIKDRL